MGLRRTDPADVDAVSATISGPVPDDTALMTVLRAVLLWITGSTVEVIRGQLNRVAEPMGPDYLVFWPLGLDPIETPTETYADPYPAAGGATYVEMGAERRFQIDCHGPNSAATATRIATLARSLVLSEYVATLSADVVLLYADAARQTPFETAETQMVQRWSIDLVLQVNAVVTLSQDFFAVAHPGIFNVDVSYPP